VHQTNGIRATKVFYAKKVFYATTKVFYATTKVFCATQQCKQFYFIVTGTRGFWLALTTTLMTTL
jgi:hypothetical protein